MLYTGVDIQEVQRISHLLNSKPTLLQKIFTEYEWEYSLKKNTAQTLTGIWCAKESVVKAFSSTVQLDIRAIKIAHDSNGAPYVTQIEDYDILSTVSISISISHTKNYAVANCVLLTTD